MEDKDEPEAIEPERDVALLLEKHRALIDEIKKAMEKVCAWLMVVLV